MVFERFVLEVVRPNVLSLWIVICFFVYLRLILLVEIVSVLVYNSFFEVINKLFILHLFQLMQYLLHLMVSIVGLVIFVL